MCCCLLSHFVCVCLFRVFVAAVGLFVCWRYCLRCVLFCVCCVCLLSYDLMCVVVVFVLLVVFRFVLRTFV